MTPEIILIGLIVGAVFVGVLLWADRDRWI